MEIKAYDFTHKGTHYSLVVFQDHQEIHITIHIHLTKVTKQTQIKH